MEYECESSKTETKQIYWINPFLLWSYDLLSFFYLYDTFSISYFISLTYIV